MARGLADFCESRGIDNAFPLLELMQAAIHRSLEPDFARWTELAPRAQVELVRKLNNWAEKQRVLGNLKEAIGILEKAREIAQEAARALPGPFLLALTLHNLGTTLEDAGSYQQALEVTAQAVALRRELVSLQSLDSRAELAASLNHLGIQLGAVGRYLESLAALEESVEIIRQIDTLSPHRFRIHLAAVLNNLSRRLHELGWRAPALRAAKEAAVYLRTLSGERPTQFVPSLAMLRHNLSRFLQINGNWQEAAILSEKAVSELRDLAQARPSAFGYSLIVALNGLAVAQMNLGEVGDALARIEESLDFLRRGQLPPSAKIARLTFISHINYAGILLNSGRGEEALTEAKWAVTSVSLPEQHGEFFQQDLALAFETLNHCLANLGQYEEALIAVQDAVRVYRDLDRQTPGAFRRELCLALIALAKRFRELERFDEGLEAVGEAENLRLTLADIERGPGRNDFDRDASRPTGTA